MILFTLLACGDKDPADDTAETADTQLQDSGDTQDTGESVHPDAPVIQSCDASCAEHTTGDTFIQWSVACAVTDPQDDAWRGTLEVTQSEASVYSDVLACGGGECTTSFRESSSGVVCDQASSYTFTVVVKDELEHESAPFSVSGSQAR